MRLAYAADLHGDVTHYTALRDVVRRVRPHALLLGGDLFAHTPDPAEQVAFARGPLREFCHQVPVPVHAIAGNTDWPVALRALEGLVRGLELRPTPLGEGFDAVGYPFVPPTPFRRKDFERRDLRGDRASLPAGAHVSDPDGGTGVVPPDHLDRLPSIEEDLAALDGVHARMVWVVHTPPHGVLDGTVSGSHVGSRALREAIVRLSPPLVLGGHIHEAPALAGRWAEPLGGTLCVNPGRGEGLHAVVADLNGAGERVAVTLWHTALSGVVPATAGPRR